MKKMMLTWALAVLTLGAYAQQYVIHGRTAAGRAVVYYRNLQSNVVDSVTVGADGAFTLTGDAAGKPFMQFSDRRDLNASVVAMLDGTVNVDLAHGTVNGTTENTYLNAAQAPIYAKVPEIMETVKLLKQHQAEGKTATPEFRALEQRYEHLTGEVAALLKKSLTEHPAAVSNAPLFYLYAGVLDEKDFNALMESKAACFDTDLLRPMVAQYRRQAESAKLRRPGNPFTDVALQTPQGTTKKLSDYCGKGNYVLVDFWASWCGPCRAEMPRVREAYEKYHPKGFEIVGVSLDNDKAAWTGAIQRMNLKWPHLSDLKGWQSAAAQAYGINSIPATLLLDPQGKIVAFGLRGRELDDKLAEIYGAAPDATTGATKVSQGAGQKAASGRSATSPRAKSGRSTQ